MISYNDLYEIFRKEKYSEVLQQLPPSFTSEYAAFIHEKKDESSKVGDLFVENVMKSKKQLENSVSLFRELMRLRKRKLLNLVFIATETGIMKRDYENMLPFEREVFDVLVRAFEECDKKVAKIINGEKENNKPKNRLVIFNQDVEQFVDMSGNVIGPFAAGTLVNLDSEVSQILVSGGKASFVDESV